MAERDAEGAVVAQMQCKCTLQMELKDHPKDAFCVHQPITEIHTPKDLVADRHQRGVVVAQKHVLEACITVSPLWMIAVCRAKQECWS